VNLDDDEDDDSLDEPHRFVAMDISTYADPSTMSFDWLLRVIPDLLATSVAVGVGRRQSLGFGTPDWGSKQRRYTEKNLLLGVDGLRNGTLDLLDLDADPVQMMTLLHSGPIEKRVASTVRFWLKPHEHHQETLLRAIKAGATEVDACTAYITVDEEHNPYECAILSPASTIIYPGLCRYVHGYYWYTVLSPSHLKVLATTGRRIDDAPVFQIDDLGAGRTGLQLSQSMLEYSDQQLLALRAFLDPLLRPGHLNPNPVRGRTFETEDRSSAD
jgi:hypothetical protein